MSLLLISALIVAYVQYVQTEEPVLRICEHCGDAVYGLPGWPMRCPSCRQFILN